MNVFGGFQCKTKQEDKYLGDLISYKGLEDSGQATITQRQGKVWGEIFEIYILVHKKGINLSSPPLDYQFTSRKVAEQPALGQNVVVII